jgi:catalase
MTDIDREHLIGNIVSHLKNANKDIQIRQARICYKADQEYGQRVADGLGITL